MKKLGLFLSAFIPMYMLVILKVLLELVFDGYNLMQVVFLLAMITFVLIGAFYAFLEIKTNNYLNAVVPTKVTNITDQHFLGYFSLFVLFALTFDLSRVSMITDFILILVMLGVVYIKNNLFFVNPFLNILGYSYYKIAYIENGKTKHVQCFSKTKIVVGNECLINFNPSTFNKRVLK